MKLKDGQAMPTENRIRRSALITVICDVILIMTLVICLLTYNSRNEVSTYNQNIESITNIATAKSKLMLAALDSSGQEVKSAYRYCAGKSESEILDYLSLIGDEENEYQLLRLREDISTEFYYCYGGHSTIKVDGEYKTVEYDDTALAYSLHQFASQTDGEIVYSQRFTNSTDALRYFAVFCSITVEEDGEAQQYFLVKPQKESSLLDRLQIYSQYKEKATAICYADGEFLARDTAFRGDNFYAFLYNYSDLSIDERNAVRESVQSDEDGNGSLLYKDAKMRDSVFAYAACGDDAQWTVIVSVPIAEFESGELLSFFPLIIIIFLAVLLAFNIWRLLMIVKELRMSVDRERVANASKSSFLSRMSHEIRTPLNAVIGYNAIAKNEMNDARTEEQRRQASAKVMDCLTKSDIASKHLLTIINDVLDMSAIESGKINVAHEQFDFKGLVTSLTTVFYSQARAKGVEFEVAFDAFTDEWFIGDQMRTNQILTNLLSNAIKFTPEGGWVKLTIRQTETTESIAYIHFEVEDNGIGMEPEYLSHIWTPFEQADSSISRRFGGTGLGLSISKNLVNLMDGNISVESQPAVGTKFDIDLSFERAMQPIGSEAYDFSGVSALVVDDDLSTCDYIRLLFNRCGAKCVAVTSGEDALEAVIRAKEKGERFTICLMDWRMPHMDGIETIKKMRLLAGGEMPTVILTAYDYTELADKAAQEGISRFVSKPLFQSTLFDLLAGVSGKQRITVADKIEERRFDGMRVILAEDNAMNMEIAKTIMEASGLTVDGAWNGREAVELFENAPSGTYMAILMDVHMPEMNGHEATRAIRSSGHPQAGSIPIIAMTADAFAENVAEAKAAGMNDHISKPIDIPTLFETLWKYAKRKERGACE